jgi:hypothetical protein
MSGVLISTLWYHRYTYQDDKAASKEEIQDEEPIKENDLVNSSDELLNQYYELEEKKANHSAATLHTSKLL